MMEAEIEAEKGGGKDEGRKRQKEGKRMRKRWQERQRKRGRKVMRLIPVSIRQILPKNYLFGAHPDNWHFSACFASGVTSTG